MAKDLVGVMVGAGTWATFQLSAWQHVQGVKITSLADKNLERATKLADEFNLNRCYSSPEAMIIELQPDFLDICTRPDSHAELVKLSTQYNLPVLCQKPFCRSWEEINTIVKLCEAENVRLMINENFRWQPYYRKVKELLLSGELGKPFMVKLHQRHRLTLPHFNHYQKYFLEMPNLALYELGTHLLDLLRFLFGEPETVYARLHRISAEVKGEDVQTIVLGFGDSLTAIITDSWASVPIKTLDRTAEERKWYPRILEIDCENGTIFVDQAGSLKIYMDSEQIDLDYPSDAIQQSHSSALKHFIECLENGCEFETNGKNTLATMRLVYAAYDSARSGQVVYL